MKKIMLASIDTGNKNIKVLLEGMEKPLLLPNALCRVTEINKRQSLGIFDNTNVNPINLLDINITTNGKELGRKYFGGLALKHGIEERPLNKNKYDDEDMLFVTLASLAFPLVLDHSNHNKTIQLKLATCLPTKEYISTQSTSLQNNNNYHAIKIHEKRLVGTHTIKFNSPHFNNANITLEIKKDDVITVSEGISALFNIVTNNEGDLLANYESILNNGAVLLIDCGGGTTDIASIMGNEIIPELIDFLNEGILYAQHRILNRLKKIDSDFNISKAELDFTIRRRDCKLIKYNEEWDISNIVKEEFEITSKNIAKSVSDLLNNTPSDIRNKLNTIFITGGSSMFFDSNIKQELNGLNIITSPTPLYDNVLGAYKIIKSQIDAINKIEDEAFIEKSNTNKESNNLKEIKIKKSI